MPGASPRLALNAERVRGIASAGGLTWTTLERRPALAAALLAATFAAAAAPASAPAPAPYGPVPSERQLRWHELEFYGFLHFTVNTFTDKEWGYGDEDPDRLQPDGLRRRPDRRGAAKAAGMRGLILTAKHHDGFCLWPSQVHRALRQEQPVAGRQGRRGAGDLRRLPRGTA